MSSKFSPWFPSDVDPVHVGVYEMECGTRWFRRWDGAVWYCGAKNPITAAVHDTFLPSQALRARWRGLARKP